MNKLTNLLIFTLIVCPELFSQSISGKITDSETGEALAYCNISLIGTYRGTTSNSDGFYQLKLPVGRYKILFQYMGYHSETIEVEINEFNTTSNIQLRPQVLPMNAVSVYANQKSAAELLILKASKRKPLNILKTISVILIPKPVTGQLFSGKRTVEFSRHILNCFSMHLVNGMKLY